MFAVTLLNFRITFLNFLYFANFPTFAVKIAKYDNNNIPCEVPKAQRFIPSGRSSKALTGRQDLRRALKDIWVLGDTGAGVMVIRMEEQPMFQEEGTA